MKPTPIYPTFSPVNNAVATYFFPVKQVLTGISVTKFDDAAKAVFIEAIIQVVPAISFYKGKVTIISVTVISSSSQSSSASQNLLRRLDTTSLQVDYTITYEAPATEQSKVYNTLKTAIQAETTPENGVSDFQTALQSIAVQNDVPALKTVKANEASAGEASQVSSNSEPAHPSIPIAAVVGGVIGGVLCLSILVGFFVYYRAKKGSNKIAYIDEFSSGFAMNPVVGRRGSVEVNNDALYADSSRYTFEVRANHNAGFVQESTKLDGRESNVKTHNFSTRPSDDQGFRITRISNETF